MNEFASYLEKLFGSSSNRESKYIDPKETKGGMVDNPNPSTIIEESHEPASPTSGEVEAKIHEEKWNSLQDVCSEGEGCAKEYMDIDPSTIDTIDIDKGSSTEGFISLYVYEKNINLTQIVAW